MFEVKFYDKLLSRYRATTFKYLDDAMLFHSTRNDKSVVYQIMKLKI